MKFTLTFKKARLDRAVKGNPLDLAQIATDLYDAWRLYKDFYPYDAKQEEGDDGFYYVKIFFANDWTDETFKTEVEADNRDYLACIKNIVQAYMNQYVAKFFNIDEYVKNQTPVHLFYDLDNRAVLNAMDDIKDYKTRDHDGERVLLPFKEVTTPATMEAEKEKEENDSDEGRR